MYTYIVQGNGLHRVTSSPTQRASESLTKAIVFTVNNWMKLKMKTSTKAAVRARALVLARKSNFPFSNNIVSPCGSYGGIVLPSTSYSN